MKFLVRINDKGWADGAKEFTSKEDMTLFVESFYSSELNKEKILVIIPELRIKE